ncbi:hypothetical protein C369_07293, partial [Cryptococcus neoformans A5-35-17]
SSVEEESSATSRSNARNTIESAPQRGQRQSVRVYRQSASGSDDGDIALVDGPRQQSKIIGSSGHRRGGKDQGNSNNPFSDTRPTASTSNHRDARLAKQSRVHKNDRDSDVEEVNRPEKLGMGTGKSRLDDLAYALKPPPRKTGRRPMMNKDGLTASTSSSMPKQQKENGPKGQAPKKTSIQSFMVARASRLPHGPFRVDTLSFYNTNMKFNRKEIGKWPVDYDQLDSLEICVHESHPLVRITLNPKVFVDNMILKGLIGDDSLVAMDELHMTLIPGQSDDLETILRNFHDKAKASAKSSKLRNHINLIE